MSDPIRASIPTGDFGEQVKLNRSFQGCGSLVSVQGIEDQPGIGFVSGATCCGHRSATLYAAESSLREELELDHLAPHDLRRTCAKICHVNGGELEQIQFSSGPCIGADH